MKTIIEIPNRASSVHRWSGVHLVNPRQNIAEHSFSVAFYCLALHKALNLWNIPLGDLLNYALIHDLPEVVTGDLPASIKQRAPEIKAILDKIEEEIFDEQLGLVNIKPDAHIKFITKTADFICVKLELEAELASGNSSEPILEAVNVVKRIYNKLFYQDYQGKISTELITSVQEYLENELGWMRTDF